MAISNIDISVIIPAYNAQNTINSTVMSVLLQKSINIEIIVINDGSVDNTKNILENLHNKYKQIQVFNMDLNMGPFYCRQFGVNQSSGKYILQLDADDSLRHQNVLYDLLTLTNDSPDIIHFWHQGVKINGNIIENISAWGNLNVKTANNSNMLRLLVQGQIHWLIHGKLIKRDTFVKAIHLLNDSRHLIYGDDEVLCIAIFSVASYYKGTAYVGYNFTQKEESVTGSKYSNINNIIKVIEDYFSARDLTQRFLTERLFTIRNSITQDQETNLENLIKFNDTLAITKVCQMYEERGLLTKSSKCDLYK
ncbi:Glycosyl_transferase family 2 protein [Hexamita inflata]|uniref:Glycosyl transferase family 2 protein n=1 Tax=Hexamita inflata TaxID=28002 RepID=A0AA86NJ51_9EUKA|nr:Glycosyl transferase family 2 protein [Hexamita inflata]